MGSELMRRGLDALEVDVLCNRLDEDEGGAVDRELPLGGLDEEDAPAPRVWELLDLRSLMSAPPTVVVEEEVP